MSKKCNFVKNVVRAVVLGCCMFIVGSATTAFAKTTQAAAPAKEFKAVVTVKAIKPIGTGNTVNIVATTMLPKKELLSLFNVSAQYNIAVQTTQPTVNGKVTGLPKSVFYKAAGKDQKSWTYLKKETATAFVQTKICKGIIERQRNAINNFIETELKK